MVSVGRSAKNSDSKGTAVKKSSQIQPVGATALPDLVSVAMTEIAENMHEGLLALAVGAGLQVMQALMEVDVTTLAGPKGKHDAPGPRCDTAASGYCEECAINKPIAD